VLPWDAPLVRRVAAAPQAEDKFRGRPRGLGEDDEAKLVMGWMKWTESLATSPHEGKGRNEVVDCKYIGRMDLEIDL
jgi:hypothetical protein